MQHAAYKIQQTSMQTYKDTKMQDTRMQRIQDAGINKMLRSLVASLSSGRRIILYIYMAPSHNCFIGTRTVHRRACQNSSLGPLGPWAHWAHWALGPVGPIGPLGPWPIGLIGPIIGPIRPIIYIYIYIYNMLYIYIYIFRMNLAPWAPDVFTYEMVPYILYAYYMYI